MSIDVFYNHSTFYTCKGKKKVYTTISHTDYHAFLRSNYKGKTYKHAQDAKLYFIGPDMPLVAPIPEGERVT